MNASYEWLREFVPVDLSPKELRDLITERCATVEDVVPLRQDLSGIVIGRVVEAVPHPDSDHLWVTKVDAGDGVVRDVVCGASNVKAGALYPFAAVGAVLPGGVKIEKRRIRGALSEGMLCSARELGLGSDHEGILALDIDAVPGTPFLDAMPVGDSRLVIDVLPNRPDLLSHEGIAREIAAACGLTLSRPGLPAPGVALSQADPDTAVVSAGRIPVEVTVDDEDGCQRYMGAHIMGVTVGPSPDWLAARIAAVGGRSISNIVDATNYMLHGFGQPMHAFDLAKLAGGRLTVRRAGAGELLRTLDGVDRTLDDCMTVIADGERVQAIAGVIGGKGSEVGATTTSIFLEAAAFSPVRIRTTRRKLGISTDASYRFERGVDVDALPLLMKYAIDLIMSVAGGKLQGEVSDTAPGPRAMRDVTVRMSRIAHVLGVPIQRDEVERNLSGVGFGVTAGPTDDHLRVAVPGYRPDVVAEIDLIEEVARLHGYSCFPSEIRPFRPGNAPDAPLEISTRRVRDSAVSAGLLEARPMPFVRTGDAVHRVRNPLAEDEAYLRTSILATLARRAEFNLAHMQRNVRLFEIGVVFGTECDAASGAPAERMHVGAVVMGDRRPAHFTEPRPPQFDEWDARALGERLAVAAYPEVDVQCIPSNEGSLWTIVANGRQVGEARMLALDAPVWASHAFGVEIDMEALLTAVPGGDAPVSGSATASAIGSPAVKYRPIPSMPAIQVDLALVVPDALTVSAVEQVVRREAGDLLESLVLFDEFRGAGVPEGARSLAWALTFRHAGRTLRERETQGRTARILTTLEKELGIRQRTS